MKPQWILTPQDGKLADELSRQLNIHPITAKILANRGIKAKEEGQRFLEPKLTYLPDPYLLTDMDRATGRISKAIRDGEKIALFGDYDVDGITSTALLIQFFKDCGVTTDYYIPNRLSEGYGLNKNGIDAIKQNGGSLIITTDNGTNNSKEIEYATSLGIDVVVTDHHEVSESLPPAHAIVNPKRLGKGNPFWELAGVGVAFYLAAALRSKLREEKLLKGPEPDLKSYLDMVAIGTVADVAPLTGLNRILVKNGIEILKKTASTGLKALAEVAATDLEKINTVSIAFRLAPRINAAGRLGSQNTGIKLLLSEERGEAVEIARTLNRMNAERQALEKKIMSHLDHMTEELDDTRSSIVLWSEKWHPGVIGIAASRLTDIHRKPCALISIEGGAGRGSVRTVGNFNILDTLNHCADVLENYGGHSAAAGFDIDIKNINLFRERFEKHASTHLSEDDRIPTIPLDAEVDIADINTQLVEEMEALAPFGEGNLPPLLATTACTAEDARIVGTNHLKLKIKDHKATLDAIGFNLGATEIDPGKKYLFAGIPQLNEWNGITSIQLNLKDIRPA